MNMGTQYYLRALVTNEVETVIVKRGLTVDESQSLREDDSDACPLHVEFLLGGLAMWINMVAQPIARDMCIDLTPQRITVKATFNPNGEYDFPQAYPYLLNCDGCIAVQSDESTELLTR